MCHGPDYGVKEYSTENVTCDITKDEKNIENTGLYRIQHKNCSAFNSHSQHHWEYKHNKPEHETTDCKKNEGLSLKGPVSNEELEVFYPCNYQQCWIRCKCNFCRLAKSKHCEHHKKHINSNTKQCVVQKEKR